MPCRGPWGSGEGGEGGGVRACPAGGPGDLVRGEREEEYVHALQGGLGIW